MSRLIIVELETEIIGNGPTQLKLDDNKKIQNLIYSPFNKVLKFKIDNNFYSTKTFWWHKEGDARLQALFCKYGSRASVLYISNSTAFIETRIF